MDCYSAIRKKEIMPFATEMDLEIIILSELPPRLDLQALDLPEQLGGPRLTPSS